MDSVYRGWVGGGGVGGGDGWGAEGGFFHTFEHKRSHCVFIEVQTATVHLPGWYGR